MVTSNLVGGLGNYLFQIAAAYSLALDNGDSVVLDDQSSVTVHKHINSYRDNILRNLTFNKPSVSVRYGEPFFHYKKIPYQPNLLINGYYQSEKYFINNKDKILKLFSIDEKSKKHINKKFKDILDLKTCSIHVRRGDYLRLPNHHPVCSLDYYKEAISLINVDKFLIFSDDIPWCKENFIGDEFIFIEGNDDYVDLWLMSLCDDNIIANSSFSWWGAWLNQNPTKKVVAPNKWFGPAIRHNIKDLIPETWIKT
jgi:hypothetical protein